MHKTLRVPRPTLVPKNERDVPMTNRKQPIVAPIALCLSILGTSSPAQALPTATPAGTQQRGSICNPTSSTLLADENCLARVWVLPPSKRPVEHRGHIANSNLNGPEISRLCGLMEAMQERSRTIHERSSEFGEQIEKLLRNIDSKHDAIAALEDEVVDYELQRELLVDELDEFDEDIEAIAEKIQEHRDKLPTDCADSDQECDKAFAELHEIENAQEDLHSDHAKAQDQDRDLEHSANLAERKIARLIDSVARLEARVESRQRFLVDTTETLLSMYRQYANLEGDTLAFAYNNDIQGNVERLKRANKSSMYKFGPVYAQDVRLRANLIPGKGSDAYLKNIPSVLDIEIEGQPVGEDDLTFHLLPDEFEGLLQLSMVATCPARNKDRWDIERDAQGNLLIGTVATYRYDLVMDAPLTVSYEISDVEAFLKGLWGGTGLGSTRDAYIAADSLARSKVLNFEFENANTSQAERRKAKRQVAMSIIEEMLADKGSARIGISTREAGQPDAFGIGSHLFPTSNRRCSGDAVCADVVWNFSSQERDDEGSTGTVTRQYHRNDIVSARGSILYAP